MRDLLPMELPLTLFVVASRARIYRQAEHALALVENDQVYGLNINASFANFDHHSSSWKTAQNCLTGGLETFSARWPRSGMMLNGTAYQLPTLAHRIAGIGFDEWKTYKPSVISYFKPSGLLLYHSFCEELLLQDAARINKAVQNGGKGGRPAKISLSNTKQTTQPVTKTKPSRNPEVTFRLSDDVNTPSKQPFELDICD